MQVSRSSLSDEARQQPAASSQVQLWRNPPRFAALHIVAVIVGGLALDSALGWTGQHLATAWACATIAFSSVTRASVRPRALSSARKLCASGSADASRPSTRAANRPTELTTPGPRGCCSRSA